MFSSHPRSNAAQVQAEVVMPYSDHLALRADTLYTARELKLLQLPNYFHTELTGIKVAPDMPYNLRNSLGWDYNRMSFGSERRLTPDEHDAFMALWLHGPTRDEQIQIATVPQSVQHGRDKLFHVTPYGQSQPAAALHYEDVGLLLDFIVPPADGSSSENFQDVFSNLADARSDLTFDEIALQVGDQLSPRAASRKTTRTYLAKDFTVSSIEHDEYMAEYGSRLVISESEGVATYKLTATAPLNVGSASIIEHFQYSFALSKRNRLQSQVSLSLASASVSRLVLAEYLQHARSHLDVSSVGQRALQLLQGGYETA